ncbi:MAG: hypothetical protein WEA56_05605 [Balneolaceae bacterium]
MRVIYSYVLILFTGLLIPLQLSAQDAETLIDADVGHGGFGSLVFGVSSINGEAAYMRGTRGAWVLKFQDGHSLNIGLAGYRSQNEFSAINWTNEDIDEPELRTNYGGLELEYINSSHQLVHVGVQALIGSGNVRYSDRNLGLEDTSDNYFVVQPGVNVNLNITNWFRASGGVFYRHTSGVNLEGTDNSGLSGFSSFIGLRFGSF